MSMVTATCRARNLKPGDVVVRAEEELEVVVVKRNGLSLEVLFSDGQTVTYQSLDTVTRRRPRPE